MHAAAPADGIDERFDRERTRALFVSYSKERTSKLRDELVVAHLNLVRYLAVRFANRGEPLDDLIQVGTVGLIKAIDRFDVERGVEFTTYATPTVIGEIKRYFRDRGWAIKVPRRLQELNLAVNRAVEALSVDLGRSAMVCDLAKHLKVSDEEIIEAQELGQAYNLLSLDSEMSAEGDAKATTLLDYIGNQDGDLELLEDRANLERALHVLDRRERIILYLRFYENVSQTEIAARLNVSQMHVSRLQQRALHKLKKFFKD
ncbi:MAG: SigB/SigF/SigG family RNA polymerase sigma factor [Candidatus Eremiobacteraeota bacterium]|nr:SigB/SigF/SigG family RNA polymerase sigma factor [Candidatus Eremiobacteraeota bacterium]MBC5826886.1 SigB/SigF/SigG family RNA polymerase sigma factor [Candidatus Eremiobacteraeota bacterium]